ncbi:MAG: hypothetical protein ACREMP_02930 [Candidatus Tyrphobacter sp.]
MNLARFAAAIAAPVLLAPALAFGAPTADQTPGVQALYSAQCADLLAGNWDAFESTLSPNFVAHVGGSSYSRDQIIGFEKSARAQASFTACTATVDSATLENGVVIAIARHDVVATASGHAITLGDGTRDMWTPQGASYVETSSTQTWSTVTVDGRVVHQSGDVPSPSPSGSP